MTGLRETWLVVLREIRERSRSTGFRAGLVVMLLVVGLVIAPGSRIDSVHSPRPVAAHRPE